LANENDRGQSLVQKGFVRTVAEAGYRCVPITTPLDATACLRDWLRKERTVAAWVKNWEPPIGVWVGLEDDGRMVTQICRSHGLRVPDDVAIIAGSNEETLCEHIQPTLTSVEVGYERIGYEAARLLDGLMDGQPQGTQTAPRTRPEPLLLPPKCLVVRESTDFFAVDNELVAAALQFIAANSHLPIQADDVARAVATEKRTLRNYFRKHLDRSIAAEVRRVRIERAKRELAQTERSIKDISRAVGFGPAMRMNETFLRELGLTPGDYRRQRRT
jgi:LacI family transcriptional regulator